MRLLIVSAVIAGAWLAASPATACDGHKDKATAGKSDAKPGTQVVLTGIVSRDGCPMQAAKIDCTGCVLVLDDAEGKGTKYMIMKDDQGDKLAKTVGKDKKQRVQIKGVIVEHDGHTLVKVKSYKILTTA